VFFHPLDHIIVRKFCEQSVNSFDILPEVVIFGRYVNVRYITTFSSGKYDLLPERTVLLEDDFSEVFRGEYGAEEAGGSSADDNDVVHKRRKRIKTYPCI